MYFRNMDGEYIFDPKHLPHAHQWCRDRVFTTLNSGDAVVIVSNTFSQMWELQPYIDMARDFNAKLTILTVETTLTDDELAARNSNDCPVEAISRVRNRWECLTRRPR